MSSITMSASFLGGAAASKARPTTSFRRSAVAVRAASRDPQEETVSAKVEASNGRRELMLAAAVAAACSVAKVAMADEPRRGSPEAKKKYGPVCVTMPTARICHY